MQYYAKCKMIGWALGLLGMICKKKTLAFSTWNYNDRGLWIRSQPYLANKTRLPYSSSLMKMKVNLDIEGVENKYLETELRGFLGWEYNFGVLFVWEAMGGFRPKPSASLATSYSIQICKPKCSTSRFHMEGQPKIYIRILNWEKKYWKKSSKDQNCQIFIAQ